MKLDLYMPFFGRDFFNALEGLRECAVSGYLRALWFYWSHTHCEGLRDDREFLQGICHLSDADWKYSEPILFGELFHLDDNHLWQQGRCQNEYAKGLDVYASRKRASLAGVAARRFVKKESYGYMDDMPSVPPPKKKR